MPKLRTIGLTSIIVIILATAVLATREIVHDDGGHLVYVGATLIDGNGGPAIENATLVIDKGRVQCIAKGDGCGELASFGHIHAANGKFITPGLIDSHVHYFQTGWLDGRPDAFYAEDIYPYDKVIERQRDNAADTHRAFMCSGVTAVFDVGGQQETLDLIDATRDDPDAPQVLAAGPLITHASRPVFDNYKDPLFLPMGSVEEALESFHRLVDMGAPAIKVWYLRPPEGEEENYDARLIAIGEAADAAGLPLIVHATGLREAKIALHAGVEVLVHSVQDQLIDDEFISLARANDTTYLPTLIVGHEWSRAIASAVLHQVPDVDDPNQCVSPEVYAKLANVTAFDAVIDRERFTTKAIQERLDRSGPRMQIMAANLVLAHKAGLRIAVATDAGNPMTLHGPSIYWEMEAMQDAGIPASDILVMATRNGAQAMGQLDETGTIEIGKVADFLVLDSDPRLDIANFRHLEEVIRLGRVHRIDDLRPQPEKD